MYKNWYQKFASSEEWLLSIAKYLNRLSMKLFNKEGELADNYKDVMDRMRNLISLLREYNNEMSGRYVPGSNKIIDVIRNFLDQVNENDPHDIANKLIPLSLRLEMYS